MQENILNKIYFIEGKNKVSIRNGVLSFIPYEKKITIDEVREVLSPFQFEEVSEFSDIFVFNNNGIEINILLKAKENYFDSSDNEGISDLNSFLSLVDQINIKIDNLISKQGYNAVEILMRKFNLNAYDLRADILCTKIECVHELVNGNCSG